MPLRRCCRRRALFRLKRRAAGGQLGEPLPEGAHKGDEFARGGALGGAGGGGDHGVDHGARGGREPLSETRTRCLYVPSTCSWSCLRRPIWAASPGCALANQRRADLQCGELPQRCASLIFVETMRVHVVEPSRCPRAGRPASSFHVRVLLNGQSLVELSVVVRPLAEAESPCTGARRERARGGVLGSSGATGRASVAVRAAVAPTGTASSARDALRRGKSATQAPSASPPCAQRRVAQVPTTRRCAKSAAGREHALGALERDAEPRIVSKDVAHCEHGAHLASARSRCVPWAAKPAPAPARAPAPAPARAAAQAAATS